MLRRGMMPTALQNHRRHGPYYLQPDYKLHEFNKRLQTHTEKCEQSWWDDLISEFFEDDATLFIQYKEGSHQRKYLIHRRLIPRYFRSLFTGGVSKVYYVVLNYKENYMNTTVTLECKQASMVTLFTKPNETKVQTDGHLSLEFSFDEFMRIKHWKFVIKDNKELISKSSLLECKGDESKLEELSKNCTESGLGKATLEYLRIGVILEPMQELMSRAKSNGSKPRESLKAVLYEKWQHQMMTQEYEQRARMWSGAPTRKSALPGDLILNEDGGRGGSTAKKRKPRKTTSVSDNKPPSKKKALSTSSATFPASTDVMLVDEPMLMGGKFGDEDERVITRLSITNRLENAQFNSNGSLDGGDDVRSAGAELPTSVASQPWKNDKLIPKEEKKD